MLALKFAEMDIVLFNRNDVITTSEETEEVLPCLPGNVGM